MRGYRRSDGLFEIEGRIIDTKPRDFTAASGGRSVPANEPLHDLGLRLVFTEELLVRAIETFTGAAPYAECPEGGRALQSIVGERMSRGWSSVVRSKLGGARSCTHLMELLIPLATVAYQSLAEVRMTKPARADASGGPASIDSCYAYRAQGEVVLRRWPSFHRPDNES